MTWCWVEINSRRPWAFLDEANEHQPPGAKNQAPRPAGGTKAQRQNGLETYRGDTNWNPKPLYMRSIDPITNSVAPSLNVGGPRRSNYGSAAHIVLHHDLLRQLHPAVANPIQLNIGGIGSQRMSLTYAQQTHLWSSTKRRNPSIKHESTVELPRNGFAVDSCDQLRTILAVSFVHLTPAC